MKNKERWDKCIAGGVIPLVEDISQDMIDTVMYVISQLLMQRIKKIFFLLSSSGGDGRVALQIVDAIRLWPGEKTVIVCGRAHSAAAVVLQAFDKRYATPNSTIVIHHGNTKVDVIDLLEPDRVITLCKEVKLDETRYVRLFKERTNMSEKEIWKLTKEDRSLFVEEAIRLGVIDGVWRKPLPWVDAKGKDE